MSPIDLRRHAAELQQRAAVCIIVATVLDILADLPKPTQVSTDESDVPHLLSWFPSRNSRSPRIDVWIDTKNVVALERWELTVDGPRRVERGETTVIDVVGIVAFVRRHMGVAA